MVEGRWRGGGGALCLCGLAGRRCVAPRPAWLCGIVWQACMAAWGQVEGRPGCVGVPWQACMAARGSSGRPAWLQGITRQAVLQGD